MYGRMVDDLLISAMSVRELEPEQVKAARAMLGWSQEELASRIAVKRQALINFEKGLHIFKSETIERCRCVMEEAGITFIATESGAVGVLLSEDVLFENRLVRRSVRR